MPLHDLRRRCVYCGPVVREATTMVNDAPACRPCARDLVAKPIDLKIEPIARSPVSALLVSV